MVSLTLGIYGAGTCQKYPVNSEWVGRPEVINPWKVCAGAIARWSRNALEMDELIIQREGQRGLAYVLPS